MGAWQCRLEVRGMSSDVRTRVASGEPKVKTMHKLMYKFFVRVVSKKHREGLDIYWCENTR